MSYRLPSRPRALLWSAVAVAAIACTAQKAKPDAAVAPADPCDDDPFGDDADGNPCPCKENPKLPFCPDPCADNPDACAADAGADADGGAKDTDTKDSKDTGAKDTAKDSAGEDGDGAELAGADDGIPDADTGADADNGGPQINTDVDAMAFVPDGAEVLGDGAIVYPDGAVVSPEEVLVANEVYTNADAADAGTDSGDGADSDGGSDVAADGDAASEDTGPAPKCKADSDCVGAPKACKAYRCMLASNGEAGCYYVNLDDGAQCDDGKACTVLDACKTGACVGTQKYCADGDGSVCTKSVCKEPTGCAVEFVDNVGCNDSNPCTDNDYCSAGKCKGGDVIKCECFKNSDCAIWDDANLCNGTLICKAQQCIVDPASVPLFAVGFTCNPANNTACKVSQCNPATGKCAPVNLPNATACSDGDACTASDSCIDGTCQGFDKVESCNDANPCTSDACDAAIGCKFTPNGNLCDDGDPCTDLDLCTLGACKGQAKKVCECQKSSDCVKFDDGDPCNGALHCVANQCALDLASVVTCLPGTACVQHACDKASGKCAPQPAGAGEPCNDGNLCTVGDSCDGQAFCKAGAPVNCNDGNPCTNDVCEFSKGCVFLSTTAPCNDGDPCTSPDVCQNGACKAGDYQCECQSDADCEKKVAAYDKCKGAWACNQSNVCVYDQKTAVPCKDDPLTPCTITECEPVSGKCVNTLLPDNASCNDGKFCTWFDHCKAGQCIGDANPCDDDKPCTADICDPKDGCKSDPIKLDGLSCSDGSACTSGDTCSAGSCVGKPKECDDKNACTVDQCSKKDGCTYSPAVKGTQCSDDNACTGDPANFKPGYQQDGCDGQGGCKGGDPKVCIADVACVDIPCNPSATATPGVPLGCENKVYTTGGPCNDGNACTTGEACKVGLCSGGTDTVCDDANACTADSCDKLKGCMHAPTAAPCDDGQPCTGSDACVDGQCKGKPKTCDDENICTDDACDPVKNPKDGCVHTKGKGSCGEFAACTDDPLPKCAFKGGEHLVISEIYLGKPGDPSDDWIEIHNPSKSTASLSDYVIEIRAVDALPDAPWTTIATAKAGTVLPPKGYHLYGAGTSAHAGMAIDTSDPKFGLELPLAQPALKGECFIDSKRHLSVRLRDVPHTLVHDRVSWDDGQAVVLAQAVTPFDADPIQWPPYASIERKASASSDNSSMYPHKPEWLAGNAYDTDTDSEDFYVRFWPEPRGKASGWYEPACAGSCALGKRCSFDASSEKCLDDVECKSFGLTSTTACGVGKVCSNAAAMCVADPAGTVLLSEIHFGQGGEQYIELYNAASKPIAIGGWRIQRKNVVDQPFKPWVIQVATIPAGVVLPPKRYYLVGTQAWGRLHGQVDQIFEVPPGLDAAGSALRLWDPATDTEVDMVGWGLALTYSLAGFDGQHKPAPAPPLGKSLERKAKLGSTAASMAAAGGDDLLGNGQDSSNDVNDFIAGEASPQSLGSGAYEPACGGTCKEGLVCNYLGGANDACVDPLCGVPCEIGRGCNPKSGQCDLSLLIAEISTDGAGSVDKAGIKIFPAANEYVVLYNPSGSAIALHNPAKKDALALQRQGPVGFLKLTETDTAKPTLTGSVPPYSYYLVAPNHYDVNLPAPDFVSAFDWGMDAGGGMVRLVRVNGYYPDGKNEVDKVAWGTFAASGEGKTAVAAQVDAVCGTGQNGAIRRKGLSVLEGAQSGDPFAAAYYVGAGVDTQVNKDDWTRIAARTPRTQKCSQPPNADGTPFCVGYPITVRP